MDVVRVGTYALLPNASMTSRSLIPLQGDVSENEELMKMSGLMIYVSTHDSVRSQSCIDLSKCACQEVAGLACVHVSTLALVYAFQ